MKEFFMRKMLEAKMKNMPVAERDKVIGMVTKNPKLFEQIAKEVEAKVKGGMSQMHASAMVMKAHEVEVRKLM